MADPSTSDRNLLERLNALKPSSINIDAPAKPAPALAIEPAKPPSREDALSDRLKSLREQSSDNKLAATPAWTLIRQDGDAIARSAVVRATQPQLGSEQSPQGDTPVLPTTTSSALTGADDIDPLLETDEQTLEELLADLGSDQDWLDSVAAEEEEYQRVTSLLEALGKAPTTDHNGAGSDTARKSRGDTGDDDDDVDNSEDDNSEGDTMAREIGQVLAHAAEEAEWEKAHNTQPPTPDLPLVPANHERSLTARPEAAEPGILLPAVPSALQDQDDDDDFSDHSSMDEAAFAAVMTSRMAALQIAPALQLPAAPTSEVDALGLPAPPTFAPDAGPAKRDEDQKTWCFCLEDGTVRCRGCGGEVYCARCWRDLHVGREAAYDMRGHRWERFDGGRR